MKIQVTAEDIRAGGHYCDTCPIYTALTRAGFKGVKVHKSGVRFEKDGLAYSSPDYGWRELGLTRVFAWIQNYDAGLPSLPIEFNLSPEVFIVQPRYLD